ERWGGWVMKGRLAVNPDNAQTRDAPRTSTAGGMPNAMAAHTPSVAQGFGILFNRLISAGSVTGFRENSALGSRLSCLVTGRSVTDAEAASSNSSLISL